MATPSAQRAGDKPSRPPFLVAAGFLGAFALTIATVVLTGLFVRAPGSAGDRAERPPAAAAPQPGAPAVAAPRAGSEAAGIPRSESDTGGRTRPVEPETSSAPGQSDAPAPPAVPAAPQ